ncbi:MAG: hypothetical protein ACREAC_01005, partial [Blastocatellia bacterium]
GGLGYYDGRQLRAYREEPGGLPKRPLHCATAMFKGDGGRVWFAIDDSLFYYDGFQWRGPVHIDVPGPQPGTTPFVLAGLESRRGSIWLITQGLILDLTDSGQVVRSERLPEQLEHSNVIFEDEERALWLGSPLGIIGRYRPSTSEWALWDLHKTFDKEPRLSQDRTDYDWAIEQIGSGPNGSLWVADLNGLITATKDGKSWEIFARYNSDLPSGADSLMTDRDGRRWLGTLKSVLVLEP